MWNNGMAIPDCRYGRTQEYKQSADSTESPSRSPAPRWWRISRGARWTRRSLCILAAILAAAPAQARVSPGEDGGTAVGNTSGGAATPAADPQITITARRDTLFASMEHLDLVLTREAGNRLNRLVVTVKLAQDEQWLADRSHEVTFRAGDTIADLRIPADDFSERVTRSGELTATVDEVGGYQTANARATVFIISRDGPVVTYSLSRASYTFAEDAGRASMELVARMAPGMPRGVTVGASIALAGRGDSGSDFTATPGEDYEVVTGTVLMVADKYRLEGGSWVGRTGVIVTLLDDGVREGTENFELRLWPPPEQSGKARLQNPDGSACENVCRHRIHITDEEDAPALELSVSSATILERGETSAVATVSITDDGSFAADQMLTLDFGGDATRGTDYVVSPADADRATSGHQLILPMESTEASATLKAVDDRVHDPNEKIEITAMHEGAAIGAMQAIRIIDDGTVSIEVAQSTVAENGGTIAYMITALTGGDLQPGPGFSMAVPVATVDGSAVYGTDFVAVSNTLTVARGDFHRTEVTAGSGDYRWMARKRGEVTLVDDEEAEAEERFTIALSAPPASSGFVLGTASAEVAITNEDRWGFAVDVSPESIREGDEAEVTLTLRLVDKTGRLSEDGRCIAGFPVTAAIALGGSASGNSDYTVPSGNLSSLRLAGCQPSRRLTLRLRALTDDESEGTEQVVFTPVLVDTRLLDPDPVLHRAASLGIENVAGPPRVSFGQASSTFAETARDAAVNLVARTEPGAPGGTPVTFSVSSRGRTATSGDDFVPVSEVITLREEDYAQENGVWVARHRLPLALLDDRVREGTEMLDLILEHAPEQTRRPRFSTPDGARCGDPCTHPVYVTDDEDMPKLEVSIDADEIGEEGQTSVTVTISISNGTTFSSDQDFTLTFEGSATEACGSRSARAPRDRWRQAPGPDRLGANSLWVDLPAGRMMVEPRTLTVGEGERNGAEILVLLTSAPTGTVTVTVTGTDGTALAVNGPTFTFQLPYWNGGWGIIVTAGSDANNTNETVTLTLSASGGGYDGQTETVVVTVRDTGAGAATASDSDGEVESEALRLLQDVTPDAAAAALFEHEGLAEAQFDALDLLGNGNGNYDLGDLLSWIARCRRGGL